MQQRSFALAAILCLTAAAASSDARAEKLAGDSLKEAVAGKVVILHTPVGSFPIKYREDGTMVSQASGSAAMYLGSARDQGTWLVRNDKLCMRFRTWLDGRQSCFTIRQEGRTVHWRRDDGRTGTATIATR
jgi:hypothetical protein